MTFARGTDADTIHAVPSDVVLGLGARLSAFGLPSVAGRILAALLTTPEPSTTATDLARQVGASRASISTMTRLLIDIGLVERVTVPRSRTLRYRMARDAWARTLDADRVRMEPMRRHLESLLDDPTGLSPRALEALGDLHAYVSFWQERMHDLRTAWESRRSNRGET